MCVVQTLVKRQKMKYFNILFLAAVCVLLVVALPTALAQYGGGGYGGRRHGGGHGGYGGGHGGYGGGRGRYQ